MSEISGSDVTALNARDLYHVSWFEFEACPFNLTNTTSKKSNSLNENLGMIPNSDNIRISFNKYFSVPYLNSRKIINEINFFLG